MLKPYNGTGFVVVRDTHPVSEICCCSHSNIHFKNRAKIVIFFEYLMLIKKMLFARHGMHYS